MTTCVGNYPLEGSKTLYSRGLTWKLWLTRRWGRKLRLPPGEYVTDGKRLWRKDDQGEEGTEQAQNDSPNGDPEAGLRGKINPYSGPGGGLGIHEGARLPTAAYDLRLLWRSLGRGHETRANRLRGPTLQLLRRIQRHALERGLDTFAWFVGFLQHYCRDFTYQFQPSFGNLGNRSSIDLQENGPQRSSQPFSIAARLQEVLWVHAVHVPEAIKSFVGVG
jgi:hypothetical protein